MRTQRKLTVVAVTGLLLLTGCSAGANSLEGGGGESADMPDPAAGADYAEEESGASSADDSDDGASDGRLFITTGSATVTTDAPRTAAARLATFVGTIDGHVQERVEDGDGDEASAYVVVRVPADAMTDTLAELEEIGDVESTSISSNEVTGRVRDLDARIRALEVSVSRLERLLVDAESTADLVAAEQALTERQEQLEQLQSEAARLGDQVALSTLEVSLVAPDAVPAKPRSGFTGGLATGWESLVATVGGLLTALGVLLPWLVVIGVLVLLGLALTRRRRDRAAGRPGGPAGPGGPGGPAGPSGPAPRPGPSTSLPLRDEPAAAPPVAASSTGTPTPTTSVPPAETADPAHPVDEVTEPVPTPALDDLAGEPAPASATRGTARKPRTGPAGS